MVFPAQPLSFGAAFWHHLPMIARLSRRSVLFVIALAGLLAFQVPFAADARQPGMIEAKVSKVLDGDTFTLSGESRRIRVWGLDAPEWNRPGGSTATAAMRQLIVGKSLRCEIRDMDRYGRYVAQCSLPDGRDIAAEMIRAGVAAEYCRYSRGYYGTC